MNNKNRPIFLITKPFYISMVFLLVGLNATIVRAAPLYYTFSGTIGNVYDGAGLAASANISIGHAVQFTFLVDQSESGYTYSYTTVSWPNYFNLYKYDSTCCNGTSQTDYFYADLLSPQTIQGTYNQVTGPYVYPLEYNYGQHTVQQHLPDTFRLVGSNSPNTFSDRIELIATAKTSSGMLSVSVGDVFLYIEEAYTGSSTFTQLTGDLTLTRISTSPVPLPLPIWLFGFGLTMLLSFAKRDSSYRACK